MILSNADQAPKDSHHLKDQVDRLIRNKIEPLSLKYHVFRPSLHSSQQCSPAQKQNHLQLRAGGKNSSCNITNRYQMRDKLVKRTARSRKAIIKMYGNYGDFSELQSKVENHIMLKRIVMMENEFSYAEECSKDEKNRKCRQLRSSPLEKYLQMFEKSEKTSEKVKMVEESSCEQMLKQIRSIKTMKNIECMEENMKDMWNSNEDPEKQRKKKKVETDPKKIMKANERKLKKQIMSDIKKVYQIQGASKIRLSMNHKKMIRIE